MKKIRTLGGRCFHDCGRGAMTAGWLTARCPPRCAPCTESGCAPTTSPGWPGRARRRSWTLRQHPAGAGPWPCAPGAWGYVGRVEVERALQEELRLEYQPGLLRPPGGQAPDAVPVRRRASAILRPAPAEGRPVPPGGPPPPRSPSTAGGRRPRPCTTYDQLTEPPGDHLLSALLSCGRPGRTAARLHPADAFCGRPTTPICCASSAPSTGRTQKVLLRAIGDRLTC